MLSDRSWPDSDLCIAKLNGHYRKWTLIQVGVNFGYRPNSVSLLNPTVNRMLLKRPELTTSRLLLRRPTIEDFDAYAAFMADERSARFVGGVQSRPVAWRGFVSLVGAWELQGFAMFSVILRDTGEWVGRVGPWMPEGWPGTEVGWGIAPDYWNRGFATEAATAAINWAFDVLEWDEVIHAIDPDNEVSIAVAKKLGARNRGRGYLPEPFDDAVIDIWGQTRQEWHSHRAA